MMQRQLQHLVRMIDDLLDLSRVRLGKITLRRQHVDFKDVLNSALETVQPLILDSKHQLTVRLPNAPCMLDADVTRLVQVLGNLLTNAAKYTPPGGCIEVNVAVEQGMLVVRITDSGVGIPPEMLTKVFELFTQVDHSLERSRGGLGLGLALVRNIVAMHGGTIEAQSRGVDAGSTFTLRLPLVQAAG
jgi:signal transduction histidine kinase